MWFMYGLGNEGKQEAVLFGDVPEEELNPMYYGNLGWSPFKKARSYVARRLQRSPTVRKAVRTVTSSYRPKTTVRRVTPRPPVPPPPPRKVVARSRKVVARSRPSSKLRSYYAGRYNYYNKLYKKYGSGSSRGRYYRDKALYYIKKYKGISGLGDVIDDLTYEIQTAGIGAAVDDIFVTGMGTYEPLGYSRMSRFRPSIVPGSRGYAPGSRGESDAARAVFQKFGLRRTPSISEVMRMSPEDRANIINQLPNSYRARFQDMISKAVEMEQRRKAHDARKIGKRIVKARSAAYGRAKYLDRLISSIDRQISSVQGQLERCEERYSSEKQKLSSMLKALQDRRAGYVAEKAKLQSPTAIHGYSGFAYIPEGTAPLFQENIDFYTGGPRAYKAVDPTEYDASEMSAML
jgi:hypothetical protein